MMARWQESFACGCGVRAKRTLAGEHFAHDDAKRVLVSGEPHLAALCLLRGHVAGCTLLGLGRVGTVAGQDLTG